MRNNNNKEKKEKGSREFLFFTNKKKGIKFTLCVARIKSMTSENSQKEKNYLEGQVLGIGKGIDLAFFEVFFLHL